MALKWAGSSTPRSGACGFIGPVAPRIEMDWIAVTALRSQITAARRRYNLAKH